MTMPLTAAVIKREQVNCPSELSEKGLVNAINALRKDLPGVVEFIEESAKQLKAKQLKESKQRWAYLSRKPAEMISRQEWDTLANGLARLFASSYAGLVTRYTSEAHGVVPAFVNCCIVVSFNEDMPVEDRERVLFELQTSQQLTPDC